MHAKRAEHAKHAEHAEHACGARGRAEEGDEREQNQQRNRVQLNQIRLRFDPHSIESLEFQSNLNQNLERFDWYSTELLAPCP